MFINDVHKKEEIKNLVLQDLKKLGIKFRYKKSRQNAQESKSRKVFKVPLQNLPMETVTLPSGQQLVVPKIVHELCSFIISKVDTEGLFRKGGSKSRQNEIKISLDARCYLGEEHHEIDVASVLKTFFRELPEPLIPYAFHELFLKCMLLPKNQTEAVLLSCLLLPTEHLNTLAYFMQFLYRVAEYMPFNKMDAYNLAVVIGPTLLPAEEKIALNATHRLTKTCELFKLLIENSGQIGVLTENLIERIALTSSSTSILQNENSTKKKKKRRSGSLTRMLSGLKKIVTHKSDDIPEVPKPDLLITPSLTRSAKKRKVENMGISDKKKQNILSSLPQNAILSTPFTPSRTPVSSHPNASKHTSPNSIVKNGKPENVKEKRLLWSHRSKLNKKSQLESVSQANLATASRSLQRRWSAVSNAAGFKKKKTRASCGNITNDSNEAQKIIDENINDTSYVRIPKTEYEEIKKRVSEIERRISIELDTVTITEKSPTRESTPVSHMNGVDNVEKAYEQTLEQSENLSPTTDQLARRLSRNLKIRQSNEHRVIRSPSARKIGSLRRRSREGNNKTSLNRNQTWCVASNMPKPVIVKRGRPSLKSNELPIRIENGQTLKNTQSFSNKSSSITDSGASWKSAQNFFTSSEKSAESLENSRASLARIRSQNAGMVMAKARLFDNLVDSNSSSKSNVVATRKVNKIGATRNLESRQSYRIRALKMEERRAGKKSMSPRRRAMKSPAIKANKLQMAARMKKNEGEFLGGLTPSICTTPKKMPPIKKQLNTKSPKRLQRGQPVGSNRQTPLKVMTNLKHEF